MLRLPLADGFSLPLAQVAAGRCCAACWSQLGLSAGAQLARRAAIARSSPRWSAVGGRPPRRLGASFAWQVDARSAASTIGAALMLCAPPSPPRVHRTRSPRLGVAAQPCVNRVLTTRLVIVWVCGRSSLHLQWVVVRAEGEQKELRGQCARVRV